MAAELRLNVALDLAYFRQQLPKLGQAAAGYRFPLQVKFDARQIRNELNKLTGRREFRINLNDAAIKSALKNTQSLQRELARLETPRGGGLSRAPIGTTRLSRSRSQGGVNVDEIKKLYEALAVAGVEGFERGVKKNRSEMVAAIGGVSEDTISGLLNGLKSGDPKVAAAAKSLGKNLINSFKDVLGIASPSREFRKIGEDSGEGLEEGLESGIKEAKSVGLHEVRNLFKALQGEARAGAAQLGAIIAGSMSGMIRLPGGREQAGRIRQAGGGVNAAMTGAAFGNIRARQQTIKSQVGSASATTPSFLAALPLLMGINQRELVARMTGLYGQSFEAPGMGRGRVMPRTNIINQLAASRGAFGTGGGAISRMFGGGGAGPAISPTGYIGRSALSPQFANYPIGMQGAYVSGGFTGGPPSSRFDFGANIRGLLPSAGMTSRQAMFAARTARAQARGGSTGEHFMQAPKGLLPSAEMQSAARTLRDFSAVAAQAMERIRRADAARARGGSTGEFFGAGGRGGGRNQLLLSAAGGGASGGAGRRAGGFGGIGPNFGRDFGRGLVGGGGGGIVGEIASEFSNATKQVLLFGTAYKALAAVTSLPGNIANAAASLQSFRNQLEAVTGGGEVMADSLKLIEETVARFNVPVQSARDGFVRLYASMKPAGIDLGTINNLFTGLSATASTFGMSADQVDRMTYALAQMASKGQIMTEELKGQLGDVFPQAVSLFAEATGFMNDTMDDAAKSEGMSQFLQALEDGAFKGEKMKQVLSNVGIALKRFEGSADKAAGSFRNQMNRLNNALTEFYESFSPVAGAFLGEFVTPVVQALTQVGDAVKLALSGEGIANNDLALYFRDELFPQLVNVKEGLVVAAQQVGQFAQALAVVLRPLAQFVLGNKELVSVVARAVVLLGAFRVAAAVVNSTGIIPLIRNIVRYNQVFRVFIAQTASGTQGMTALRAASAATGTSMRQAAGGVRVLATAIRTTLVTSAIGIALVAISALIEKIMQLKATADSIERQRGGAGTRIRKAAEMAGTEGMKAEQARVGGEIKSREKSIAILERLQQGGTISEKDRAQLQATGSLPSGLLRTEGGFTAKSLSYGGGGTFKETIKGDVGEVLENNKKSLAAFTEGMDKLTQDAAKNAAVVDARSKQQAQMDFTGLTGGEGGEGGGGKGTKERVDMTKDMYTLNKLIREEQEKVNQLTKDANPLRLAELEYQRDILKVKESDMLATEKADAMDEAASKKRQAIFEFFKKYNEDVLKFKEEELRKQEEINRAREEYKALLIDAQEATGAISPNEAAQRRRDAEQLQIIERLKGVLTPTQIEDLKLAFEAIPKVGSIGEAMVALKQDFEELTDPVNMLMESAQGIGNAFGDAFSSIITGASSAQESLGQFFGNVGKMFADMTARILSQWMVMKAVGLIGSLFPGGSAAAPGGSGGSGIPFLTNLGADAGSYRPIGVPLTPYANGGVVTGPTMGLIGEGRFNEAVVPLPNGKSIPVELGGGAGNNVSTNIVVNVNNGQASSQINGNGGQSLGRELEGAVRSVIVKESRPGGIIYSQR